MHSVAAEADKNAYFGAGKWDAGDASHTYIVQFSDGQHVHVLRPDKEVDYAGRGATMQLGQWSVVDKVVDIMCCEGSKCRSGTVHTDKEGHEQHWHTVHLSDVGVTEARVSADSFVWCCPGCIAAAEGHTIAADVSMGEASEDVLMLEGSDGGGGAAAGQKHSMAAMQRTGGHKARKLGDALELQWELNFAALKAFAAENNGDPNCPCNHEVTPAAGGASAKPLRLGAWLSRQRVAYKEGNLVEARKQRLTELGVVFHGTASRFQGVALAHEMACGHQNWKAILSVAGRTCTTYRGTCASETEAALLRIVVVWK